MRSPASVRWLTPQHSSIVGPVHMGSGNAIWVLVTPPILWSHFTYHIFSIYRISSPRHIPSSPHVSRHITAQSAQFYGPHGLWPRIVGMRLVTVHTCR